MTERPARAARRGLGMSRLSLGAAALVAVVFVLMAERVAAGTDPVLRTFHRAVAQPVIVRHIVKKVVVETTIRRRGHAAPPRTTESSSPLTTSQSGGEESAAPVTRSS